VESEAMKKITLTLLLLLPALLAQADTKKDAESFYSKLAAYAQKEDLKGMQALVAEKATFDLPQRPQLTRAQWSRMIGRTFEAMDKFSVRYTIVSVTPESKTQPIRVRLTQLTSAVYKDPQGKPHTMEVSRALEDTLVRGKSGLLLTSSKIKVVSQKIDGKLAK
jgi:hypothetical protein